MVEKRNNNQQAPVLIVGAMPTETDVLAASLEGAREDAQAYGHILEGMLCGQPVVVLTCGIGMVNAAAATALAIERHAPRFVITQGTAGAHDPDLRRGDIVLADQTRHIHFIVTSERGAGEGVDPTTWGFVGPETVLAPGDAIDETLCCDRALLKTALSVPNPAGRLMAGIVGSGDVWNHEIDRIVELSNLLGTSCEDMETYAIAQVCTRLSVPWLGVRVISNNEQIPGEDYDEAFAVQAQEFICALLGELAQ